MREVVGALVSSAQRIYRRLAQAPLLWVLSTRRFAENEFFYSVVFFLWACVIAELFLFSRTLPAGGRF